MKSPRNILLAALCLAWAACAGQAVHTPTPIRAERLIKEVVVIEHGRHVGIVVRRADIPEASWPEHRDLPAGGYLEVGWGDLAFYRSPNPGLGLTLEAALWSTPSVLHIVAFDGPVADYFPRGEMVAIAMTDADFDRLCRAISAAYSTDSAGNPIALGPGLYGVGRFYRARERYHLFNNCNVWAARVLRAGGCPTSSAGAITASGLLRQARSCGRVIRPG